VLIAHLTDTHVLARGGRIAGDLDPARRLGGCIQTIGDLRPQPDAVVITGDPTDGGREEEYVRLRELLAPLSTPCFLIPGNHDTTAPMRRVFADHGYLFADQAFMHYTVDELPVRLIGLDTRLPDQSGGTLCEARLGWLEQRLTERPHLATLLLMHHPPIEVGIPHMDAIGCGNAGALSRILSKHRQVLHILCGHVHRMVQGGLNGVAITVGPSTSHAIALDTQGRGGIETVPHPPAFCLLNISDTGATTVHLEYPSRH